MDYKLLNDQQVRVLLAKYWKGESEIAEEKQLSLYFSKGRKKLFIQYLLLLRQQELL